MLAFVTRLTMENKAPLNWDRSHDVVLQRFHHDVTRVAIQFQQAPPSITELMALRRCLPQFRHLPPAVLRERLSESQELSLGELPTIEARRIIDGIQATGLRV